MGGEQKVLFYGRITINKAGMMKIKYLYLTITIVVKMVSVKNH